MAMWGSRELVLLWLLVLAASGVDHVCGANHVYQPGRRVCADRAPRGAVSESFVQRVYQPFLTICNGHRACSTYRTIYRIAYRRSPRPAPARPRYVCCPGWKRTNRLPGACGADVDECSWGRGGCPQHCVNTAGSYRCQCQEGHRLSADGTLCLPMRGPPMVAPSRRPGVDREVEQEVQSLQSRVAVLEQKLQLVLAPLHSLASRALELGLPDPSSLLAHSFRQLERIDSLSEQISFLEEQLGACSCKKEL
ncbi:epidermal growth factor-like protein 7 isoform X8 [Elephas maximus indicus]|uniref:epidermal growth factor-like protein 7 isoform X8 n=1 Tax=Elephas maximus indicus TaxID=99487 RepID=UPI0021165557|nr:epidermal growth factor-like protein 7 isoform X8 [Elephas maximus indicus]